MTYIPPQYGASPRYALLGDEIVIADKVVASRYQELLKKLGVTISLGKSVICETASFEFAKRFFAADRYGTLWDVSPVSLVDLASARSQSRVSANWAIEGHQHQP